MALVKATLKAAIKQAILDQNTKTTAQPAPIEDLADKLTNAIADAVVQAINTAVVVPTLTSPSGTVTGTILITASAT